VASCGHGIAVGGPYQLWGRYGGRDEGTEEGMSKGFHILYHIDLRVRVHPIKMSEVNVT
jgi:hypothetical protein